MKGKLAKLKLLDLSVFGILMLVFLAMPHIGYTYKKVAYTLSGFDLIGGVNGIVGGKVDISPSWILILVLIASIAVLVAGIVSLKSEKTGARIGMWASLVAAVFSIYFMTQISDLISNKNAKNVGAAFGVIILVLLAVAALVRCIIWLYRHKVLSALDFMAVPGMLYFFINNYIPMVGIAIAFKKVDYSVGLVASPWTGFDNFKNLFQSNAGFFKSNAWIITRNTLLYNVCFIILGIVTGLIIGLCLAGITRKALQKFFQTSILLPQLISYVIVAYIVYAFFSNETGIVNHLLGEENAINFYQTPKYWPFILVFINIWKQIGYNGIIFLSSIIGISIDVLEASRIDGCSKWEQLRFVTLPMLKPTIITLTMLQVGRIFYSDFGLFYQVPLNSGALYSVTDTVDTYVYQMLMTMNNISVSSAASTYQAVLGFIIVLIVNMIVRAKDKENALF